MTALDSDRFHALWTRLTGSPDSSGGAHRAFRRLRRAHRQIWRSYHDTSHVVAVLAELDPVRERLDDPDVAEMAVWFHDAVYVPWRSRNEARSAKLVRKLLADTGTENDRLDRIESHILATRHQAEPNDPDARLVVDADLAILGASPDRYDEYERQVRREYIWVPRSKYRTARADILQGFLDRDAIYRTESFRAEYEDAARANLVRAISRLASRIPSPVRIHAPRSIIGRPLRTVRTFPRTNIREPPPRTAPCSPHAHASPFSSSPP